MIVFKSQDQKYIYIHIPKNNGKYIRSLIKNQFSIIQEFWHIKNDLDLAHIPYILANKFINDDILNYNTITFIRNPYDRIISAFFYKHPHKTKKDFLHFIKNKLLNFNFDNTFPSNIIHYYPQYKFIEGCNLNLEIVSFKNIETDNILFSCKLKLINFKNKTYNHKEYFDTEALAIIDNIYKKDILLYYNYE
jgi:hypothetical protein